MTEGQQDDLKKLLKDPEFAAEFGAAIRDYAKDGFILYALYNDLFHHGYTNSGAKDVDGKNLAGLQCVVLFDKKIEKWASNVLKTLQAASSRDDKISASKARNQLEDIKYEPRFKGYENTYMEKYFGTKEDQEVINSLNEQKTNRRQWLGGGLTAAGLMATEGSVMMLTNPSFTAEQTKEFESKKTWQEAKGVKDCLVEDAKDIKPGTLAAIQEAKAAEKDALKKLELATEQRKATKVPEYEATAKNYKDWNGIGVMILGGGLGTAIATAAVAAATHQSSAQDRKIIKDLAASNSEGVKMREYDGEAGLDMELAEFRRSIARDAAKQLSGGIAPMLRKLVEDMRERKGNALG